MVSAVILLIFLALVFYYLYKNAYERPKNFPPGPPKIPFFGSYLFLLILNPWFLHKSALFLSKIYKSKVIGFYIGKYPIIVANDYKGIKEILNRQEFDGRPDLIIGRLRDPDFNRTGIFFMDGWKWKEQRRFLLRYLRDFGFGRRFEELEIFMNEELLDMINLIKNGPKYLHEKKFAKINEVLCSNFMCPFVFNMFMKILCDERIPRSEMESTMELVKQSYILQRTGDAYGRLVSLMPWIRFIFPNISGYKLLRESSMYMQQHIKLILDKYLESYDENYERNFIDIYIKKMKAEEKLGIETSFSYDQFVLGIVDFIFPAITAVEAQISFLFQYFLLKPIILKKIQKEIDDVIGHGRLPKLDDRKNLPYTEASIREIMRIETLVPSSVPHLALEDCELQGFQIPKGTVVMTGLSAFHHDENLWGDPNVFRPERFLDENGQLDLKKDISLPFGAGKRLCAGETFARNAIFLIVTTLCQQFDIITRPNESLPDMRKTLHGLIITPPDFWISFSPR